MSNIDGLAEQLLKWRQRPDLFVREVFNVTPDAWQDDVLKVFPHEQRIALKAPIALDSPIWTPKGLQKWGDIQIGDKLFAEDGSVTKVLRRFDVGIVPLYRVTFRDGTSLRVSHDHEWDVLTPYDRKHNKRRTVSTKELMELNIKSSTGQRLISIPQQKPVQFSKKKLPADPYVFGLWLGDGIANEPRLICPDTAIRQEIISRGQEISESTAVKKRIGLKGWLSKLQATGMRTCRSYEKYIPLLYKMGSTKQRLDLLRGLMDSDGTCATNGHTYLASCSEQLIDDFIWLSRSLGFLSTKMGPYIINNGLNRNSYRAVITGRICPFLANTNKRRRWRKPIKGKYYRFIDSVVADGEGAAMCVEVNNASHCFQASDFIVTHNCKGPGKTCVLAWLIWNFLLTRQKPQIAVTSITADALSDTIWKELAKWQQASPLLQHLFTWTKTRIFAKENPQVWFCSARPWSRSADASQQGNALAGLHADNILFVLDESGGIPDAVMASAEAALSSSIEGHIIQAGNPTHLEGPLYRACTKDRKQWHVTEITSDPDDPKRTPRVSIKWAQEQIEQWGRDHPYVLVNVFGKFPPSSLNALIGHDEVSAAMKRDYRAHDFNAAAIVLGIDVARMGDDSSVIFRRQGIQAFNPIQYRNIDGTQGAGLVARIWNDQKVDACFIDDTGGFGSSWIDNLRRLGFAPIGIHFSKTSVNPRYYNKRTEMIFDCIQWIKEGGALPYCPELLAALTQTTYTFKGDKLLIEPKELVKEKIGYSPDHMDSLCFVANTMISTPYGTVPIQELKENDLVCTPFGTTKIAKVWVTKTDKLTTVEFNNGSILAGKGEHKIFTWTAGKCRLDALLLTDVVSTIKDKWKWQILKWFTIKNLNSEFKPLVDIINPTHASKGWRDYFIGVCGLTISALYHQSTTFITKTAIGAIMKLITLNAYQPQHTTVSTPRFIMPIIKKLPLNIWIQLGARHQNGIEVKREGYGTVKIQKSNGQIKLPLLNNVSYVKKTMRLGCKILPIALEHVIIKSFLKLITQIKGNAHGVIKNLWQTATGTQNVVPVHVVTENVDPTSVYNLTLKRHNAYYANDILVYNCLTFAEPVLKTDMRTINKYSKHQVHYDPLSLEYASKDFGSKGQQGSHSYNYDPLSY